jgi:glutathione S-transferase
MRASALVVLLLGTLGLAGCRGEPEPLIERLARIEHEQWMAWSQSVADEVSPARRERWQRYWVPYEELPEDIKELDRQWARRVLAELEERG